MFVALVTGSVVATQKAATMTGHKLLIVEPYRVDEKSRTKLVPTGRTFIAVDTLGAGEGQFVLITQATSWTRRSLTRDRRRGDDHRHLSWHLRSHHQWPL